MISLPLALLVSLLAVSNSSLLVDTAAYLGFSSPGNMAASFTIFSSSPPTPVIMSYAAGPSTMGQMPISEVGSSVYPLLVSILLSVDFIGPPITMAAATGLLTSTLLPPPLMLTSMLASYLVDCLMKGAMVAMGKRKSASHVPLPSVNLAKPLLKVLQALVEGMIPELCSDKELLARHFYFN